MNKTIDNIKICVLLLFIIIIALSYLPLFRNAESIDIKSKLNIYTQFVFALLFLLSLFTLKVRQLNNIKNLMYVYIYSITFVAVSLLLLTGIGYSIDTGIIFPLILSFSAIIIGWQLKVSDRTLKFICTVFSVTVLVVSVILIITDIGGFVIDSYKIHTKNAIGALCACSVVVSFWFALNKQQHKIYNILFLMLFAALFISVLTIRARLSSVVAIIICVYIAFQKIKTLRQKQKIKIVAVSLILIGLLFIVNVSTVTNYITNSLATAEGGGDITTGRLDRNILALDFLSDNLLFGNISNNSKLIVNEGAIHNFPLFQLFNYGLVFSLPVLILYVYLFINVFKNLTKIGAFGIKKIGFPLLAHSFLLSLFEPTAPFGPGTVHLFNFILFGIALQNNYELKKHYSI